MALSKSQIKYIHSLELKKNRKNDKVFLAEGPKLVGDLLGHFSCQLLIATQEWLEKHLPNIPANKIITVTEEELTRASLLKNPQQVLAVFMQPDESIDYTVINQSLCLALDGIQDPGNLGTIIRLADWFGIEHIFCSPNTVDAYNPKTIQATMGGIAHVKVHYTSLPQLIRSANNCTVYGTFLDGSNIYSSTLGTTGLIVMGNEGNGISPEIEKLVNQKLYIPNYPLGKETTDSLNVAIATAIVCAEFRRRGA